MCTHFAKTYVMPNTAMSNRTQVRVETLLLRQKMLTNFKNCPFLANVFAKWSIGLTTIITTPRSILNNSSIKTTVSEDTMFTCKVSNIVMTYNHSDILCSTDIRTALKKIYETRDANNAGEWDSRSTICNKP